VSLPAVSSVRHCQSLDRSLMTLQMLVGCSNHRRCYWVKAAINFLTFGTPIPVTLSYPAVA
jgi:hypothetical protein